MYLYETHAHTSRGSKCARSTPAEMAQYYAENGYSGLFITEHFTRGNTAVPEQWDWQRRVDRYYSSIIQAQKAVQGYDLHVMFGFEEYYGGSKELLVYNVTPEFLASHEEISQLIRHDIDGWAALLHSAGAVIVHAHPYRYRQSYMPSQPTGQRFDLCDGIEVINGANTPQENLEAFQAQQKTGLFMTGGNDRHQVGNAHRRDIAVGVAFDEKIKDAADFADKCKNGFAKPVYDGIIVDSADRYREIVGLK